MNTRRDFLTTSAIALAGITLLPSCFKKPGVAPSDLLNIAVVGAGGRGHYGVLAIKDNPLVNLVGFADVDDNRASNTYKMFPKIPRYKDFRKMLDDLDKQIDAVIIATPDHTHHYITKWCMNIGKHVFVEKPLAHSISEVRELMKLEKETGLVCQMGNQGHSGAGNFLIQEWNKMGLFGTVEKVDAWTTHVGESFPDVDYPEGEPIPETLDWDLWLGPAKKRPFNWKYLPGRWRNWFDFGSGMLGDMACHNIDAAFRALELDCPKKIEIETSEPRVLSFPKNVKVIFTFPSKTVGKDMVLRWFHGPDFPPPRPKELEVYAGMGGVHGGTIMYGSEHSIMIENHASRPRFFPSKIQQELLPQINESLEKIPADLPPTHTKNDFRQSTKYHYNNWLQAIKGEAKCNSDFEFSGRLTETILFANIALHLNCNLDIDPAKRTIIGNEVASNMIHSIPRKGWEI